MSGRRPEGFHVWPAFTDLMSGIALVLLLFGVSEARRAAEARDAQERTERQRVEGAVRIAELEKRLAAETRKHGVKEDIVVQLEATLARQHIKVSHDALWNLEIAADMLFPSNGFRMSPPQAASAQVIGAALVSLLRDPAWGKSIAMLTVIGHTDQEGPASHNLDLSSKRAVGLVELWQRTYLPDRETSAAERCLAAKIVAAGVRASRPGVADEHPEPCGTLAQDPTGCRRTRRCEIRVLPTDEPAPGLAACH